jgi:hypothetical protein
MDNRRAEHPIFAVKILVLSRLLRTGRPGHCIAPLKVPAISTKPWESTAMASAWSPFGERFTDF